MLGLCVKEGVGDAEIVVTAELLELSIFVQLPNSKVAHVGWPRAEISNNSGVKLSKEEDWLLLWNVFESRAELRSS